MSEQALGFEYARVFNIPGDWIYQGTEYLSGFEYVRVLDIPRLLICQVYTGFEYAWLCLNVPKSVWMAFVLHLPIVIPYLKES